MPKIWQEMLKIRKMKTLKSVQKPELEISKDDKGKELLMMCAKTKRT